jgi:hypothetical protein
MSSILGEFGARIVQERRRILESMVAPAIEIKRAAKGWSRLFSGPAFERWGARSHYDWALEAFDTQDEQPQLEELTANLGLPKRQAGNVAAVALQWRLEGNYPDPPDLPRLREIWTRAVLAYDSDRVQPVRLAGSDVISLDALPEIVYSVQELTRVRADFPTVLLGLGFDFEEARFIEANKIEGLTRRDAGASLGWDDKRTERVRRRCVRKANNLVRSKAGLLAPQPGIVKIGGREWPAGAFERLESGRLIWQDALPR